MRFVYLFQQNNACSKKLLDRRIQTPMDPDERHIGVHPNRHWINFLESMLLQQWVPLIVFAEDRPVPARSLLAIAKIDYWPYLLLDWDKPVEAVRLQVRCENMSKIGEPGKIDWI